MEIANLLAEMQILSDNFINLATRKIAGSEYKILCILNVYKVCTPKIMMSKIGMLKTNLANSLKKLIKYGYVSVQRSTKDSRAKQYSLTEEGESVINKILEGIEKNLSDANSAELKNALSVVTGVLNKKL